METFVAATRFWALFCCALAIQLFMNKVECKKDARNKVFDNSPERCTCDEDLQTVNCTNAGYTKVPSDIFPDTRSLILDGNFFRHLRDSSFRHLRRLSNLSLRNCQINKVHSKAFSPLSETLRVLWMSNNTLTKKKYTFPSSLRNIELLD